MFNGGAVVVTLYREQSPVTHRSSMRHRAFTVPGKFGLLTILSLACGCHGDFAKMNAREESLGNPGVALFRDENLTGGAAGRVGGTESAQGNFNHCIWGRGFWPACNDDAESFELQEVPARTLIRFFDDGGFKTTDDWVEIYVKRYVSRRGFRSFQMNHDDDDVRMTFHLHDGLDNHVSAAQWFLDASPPTQLQSDAAAATQRAK